LTDSYERNADNFRVIVEPVYDKVDPPRFLPLVGRASLHRVRFKCTVYYTQANEEISKVFNIDRDHLHVIESEIKATTSRRNGEQPPVDFPAPPVYGGRNPKTGDAELNPAWANPVRRMLVKTNEIESGARVPTEPSSRNSPTKLPDGLTKEARYCLLKLGDQKQTDIWLIQDRDWLYVDLNGDGDLSSPDERFVEKEEQGFSIPELTSRGYVIPPSLQSDPEVRGYFPLRLSWQKTGEQNLWVRLFVENKYWQESIISASATKPELAPILHFDGPLRYFLLHPTSRFTVGETPLSMAVAIGTVSETGDITYVDLDEPPLEGKVISDLTVRYYATVDSEPREIETNGLTPDGYGGHLISTLKTTDDMQSGKIEIEVRSPEDSRLPVAPLKSRIPLVKSKAAPTDSSP
ncbi:MAG TPA: hypothetical protein VLA12_00535, partial [Planctomycetaceae bacterium]|nr:hypothetical protein [Planctomycetaceae bacterium]